MNQAITRVGQPINETGSLAVKIPVNSLEYGRFSDANIQFAPRLVVRDPVRMK